jgi:hypothetical protein
MKARRQGAHRRCGAGALGREPDPDLDLDPEPDREPDLDPVPEPDLDPAPRPAARAIGSPYRARK